MSTGTKPEAGHSTEWLNRLQAALDAPQEPLPPDLEAHLRNCAHCGAQFQALRDVDAGLARRFGGVTPSAGFDLEVLRRARAMDAEQIAARREAAQRQHARRTAALAHSWRATKHVLGARLLALAVTLVSVLVALFAALPSLPPRVANLFHVAVAADHQQFI